MTAQPIRPCHPLRFAVVVWLGISISPTFLPAQVTTEKPVLKSEDDAKPLEVRTENPAIKHGLEWLKANQQQTGPWPGGIRATSLAALAIVGDGNTMRVGPYKDAVKRSVKWLREQQDVDSGRFGGPDVSLLDHAIASLAFVEIYGVSGYKLLKRNAQKGINYLESKREAGGWLHNGAFDPELTHWCVTAMVSARDFGLKIPDDFVDGALAVYAKRAEQLDKKAKPPLEAAACLMPLALLGQKPSDTAIMQQAMGAVQSRTPKGELPALYAMVAAYGAFQMGDEFWSYWERKVQPRIAASQHLEGKERGSWGSGAIETRVAETALRVLTLEASYHYKRITIR